MVTFLPVVKAENITYCLDRLIDNAGEESVVMMHVGTNDTVKCSYMVL